MAEHLIFSRRTYDPHGGQALPARLRGSAGATLALVVVALALVAVAGCGTTSGPSAGAGSPSTGTTPGAANTLTPRSLPAPSGITECPLPTSIISRGPSGIISGPDSNLWFAEQNGDTIGRITPAGQITEFPLPSGSGPVEITVGPDGNLWFTENVSSKIGRITTKGQISEFSIPTTNSSPQGITAGPDGALWFTETDANQIGRLTPGK